MKKGFLYLVMLTVIVVTAACGLNKNSDGEKNALQKIKEQGVINVGIEGAYPPFNFYNSSNELEGICKKPIRINSKDFYRVNLPVSSAKNVVACEILN